MEDAFVCKHPDLDVVKFVRMKDGLYVYKPTENYIQDVEHVEDAEAMSKPEKHFEGFLDNVGAISKFKENFEDSTKHTEASQNFEKGNMEEFQTQTLHVQKL